MTFQERLSKVMLDGNLTVADLARWFGRSHPTVGAWVRDGAEPAGGPLDRKMVFDSLEELEKKIKLSKMFPVPRLSPSARMAYIDKLMHK